MLPSPPASCSASWTRRQPQIHAATVAFKTAPTRLHRRPQFQSVDPPSTVRHRRPCLRGTHRSRAARTRSCLTSSRRLLPFLDSVLDPSQKHAAPNSESLFYVSRHVAV
ncbi:hypothetical protein LMH87_010770 [Akanthomyces muscarius]|uniref:Uncharacterized protein n=1 Tax=Akanthomyces muscarius TaxID=2231603 RepID=A0A9W8Q9A6_AKAMU|nr:hypothetical protein LMH87_010770 [Akanthomyces muscarius]KAJ4150001.1 hypothetical protein LMH87_010770 [Akanthomyces muscarius]